MRNASPEFEESREESPLAVFGTTTEQAEDLPQQSRAELAVDHSDAQAKTRVILTSMLRHRNMTRRFAFSGCADRHFSYGRSTLNHSESFLAWEDHIRPYADDVVDQGYIYVRELQ